MRLFVYNGEFHDLRPILREDRQFWVEHKKQFPKTSLVPEILSLILVAIPLELSSVSPSVR
jgi:hypothetical protein